MDSLSQFIKQREQETLLREKKFPLRCLLLLYYKAPQLLSLDYYEGLHLLWNWLGPIDIPPDNGIKTPTGLAPADYYWAWYTQFKLPKDIVYQAILQMNEMESTK